MAAVGVNGEVTVHVDVANDGGIEDNASSVAIPVLFQVIMMMLQQLVMEKTIELVFSVVALNVVGQFVELPRLR
ncbi:hypothetical protein JIN77_02575 [Verrucomicrobiaceae bacterium R5-34]|nr:hypothetical protein [Verrucomicrobiaceae bacterium R5-34]